MGGLEIALIIFAVISAVVLIIFLIGKISAGHKKISPALLKRFSKQKQQDKTPSAAEKQENQAQTADQEQPQFEFDQKPNKSKQPIIESFDQLDQSDKALFGLEEEKPQPRPPQEEVRRKSFEEIMRNRQMHRQDVSQDFFEDEDDSFEKFRAEHSSYTSYVKDDDLIAQIQSMPPHMKAIIFGNLFNRPNHDD